MADQPLLRNQEETTITTKNYRVNSKAGVTTIVPLVDDATRKALAEERLAELGGGVHGKDGRTRSLATREAIDAEKLIANAKSLCKNPIKLSWKNIKF